MKFRFCGNADCPDWILAEIYTVSKLSSIKLKLLGQVVAQGLIDPPINIDKAEKLFADSKLDANIDIKACMACINFIITSATCYNCDHGALFSELQQLGLPREHSMSIKKVVDEYSPLLKTELEKTSLTINKLINLSTSVDLVTQSASLDITVNNKTESLVLSPVTVDVLIDNLEIVKAKMMQLNNS